MAPAGVPERPNSPATRSRDCAGESSSQRRDSPLQQTRDVCRLNVIGVVPRRKPSSLSGGRFFYFIDEGRHEMFEMLSTAPGSPRCLLARLPRLHRKIIAIKMKAQMDL